jgi:holo-[acyl-carrier protein] synthase
LILGIGIDLVEIPRMKVAYDRRPTRLARRICTSKELDRLDGEKDKALSLAVFFGVKEAVMKALGTGMRGVGWKEIETSADLEGPVEDILTGRALAVARRKGATRYCFSVTMSDEVVLATVLLSTVDPKPG